MYCFSVHQIHSFFLKDHQVKNYNLKKHFATANRKSSSFISLQYADNLIQLSQATITLSSHYMEMRERKKIGKRCSMRDHHNKKCLWELVVSQAAFLFSLLFKK